MRNLIVTAFFVALFIAFPGVYLAQGADASGSDSLWGVATSAATGLPLRHAQVQLCLPSAERADSYVAGNDGRFEFTDLRPGRYQVRVSMVGYRNFQAFVEISGKNGPLSLRLLPVPAPYTPRNDAVVTVQELKHGGKAEGPFAKGTALLLKGNAAASVVYFERALSKDPGYYRAYHNLGLAQYRLGHIDRAKENFQKAIELTNGGYAPSEFALGMIFLDTQELQQALPLIQRGLEVEPRSSVGRYVLGLAQFSIGQLADAEKSARTALQQNSNQVDAYMLLARIHEKYHNPYAAMSDAESYLRFDPEGTFQNEARGLLTRVRQQIENASAASLRVNR